MNMKVHIMVFLQMVVLGVAIATAQARRDGSSVGAVGTAIRLTLGLLIASGTAPPTAATRLVFVL